MTVLLANAPTRIPLPDGRERFFVKAGSRWPFSIVKRPGESCRYLPFPFSLAYLAALLDRAGIRVEVFDGVALNVDRKSFLQRCTGYAPRIILLESTTPTIESDLALCRDLKHQTGALIALAGAHPTSFAEEILRENEAVDWIFKGEYELNALRAIEIALAGCTPTAGRLTDVPGLVHASSGEPRYVQQGPPSGPIDDLDALPFPARHLFPTRQAPTMWPYWDGFCQRRPAIQMQSSRGCPFRCTFCCWVSVIYNNGPYRTFSAGRIVDEMQAVIARYNAREIYFDDDIFTASERHVLELCREIRARDLEVAWSAMGDAMAVTERAIEAMAEAGCIGMKFGVESANTTVLKSLKKPVKIEKVRQVVRWCAERGIKTHATITFGLEGDTLESMQETLDFARTLSVDSIQFSIATPFPGTELYRRARDRGRLKQVSWDRFDGALSSVLTFGEMTPEQVSDFAARAPSLWLRSRLRDRAWLSRQARYFARIAQDQGLAGLSRRARRGLDLLLNRPG